MSEGLPGTPLYVTGTVRDLDGKPVGGAVLDVWQADTGRRLRGAARTSTRRGCAAKYTTREDGTYCVRTIAPLGYSIPMDGPVGELIGAHRDQPLPPGARALPASTSPGYEPLITHLFQEGAEYLDSDVVFGTKAELVVAFEHARAGPDPGRRHVGRCRGCWRVYDFVLQPERATGA